MKNWTITVLLLAVCISLAASSSVANAASVRGKLLRADRTPAAGILVSVTSRNSGAQSGVVTTSSEGMFYLYNVAPGAYYLVVWLGDGSGRKSTRYEINVTEPRLDVPEISLP